MKSFVIEAFSCCLICNLLEQKSSPPWLLIVDLQVTERTAGFCFRVRINPTVSLVLPRRSKIANPALLIPLQTRIEFRCLNSDSGGPVSIEQ